MNDEHDTAGGGPAILVPAAPAPTPAVQYPVRPTGAAFEGGVLTVRHKDGSVAVPADALVVCNGVVNAPANVPGWLDFHAGEVVRAKLANDRRAAEGRAPVPPVPAVYFTLSDATGGPVARFDQR